MEGGQKVGLDLQGRTTALPCLDLEPSTFSLPLQRPWWVLAREPGASTLHPFKGSRKTPCPQDAGVRSPWIFQLHPESPCPTSRRLFPRPHPQGHPGALASKGRSIKVFQFFFPFKSVPKRKDHFAVVFAALVMDLVVFLSVRTFLLHWSQPRAHSILLFVDFGPMYFMGIDTYINI